MKDRIKKYPITFGIVLIVLAYFLDTFGILINSGDILYKTLNLIGAVFIAYPLLRFRNYSAFVIAFVWFIISLYSIFISIL